MVGAIKCEACMVGAIECEVCMVGTTIRLVTGARVSTLTNQCCCVFWALYGADGIIKGGQTNLSLPHPGCFLLTRTSQDLFEGCLSTLTCFWQLRL